jgi:hypothetical protein
VQVLDGVEFDIRGIILLLRSQLKSAKMDYPKQLDQIKVGRKSRWVHFPARGQLERNRRHGDWQPPAPLRQG